MNKLFLILAALGLGTAVPAKAQLSADVHIGQPRHGETRGFVFNRYESYYDSSDSFYNYRHYKRYPRCHRWEVAVRSPYRPGWLCMNRDEYRRWQRR